MKYLKRMFVGLITLATSLTSIQALGLPWSDDSHDIYYVDSDNDGEFDDLLFQASPRSIEVPYNIFLEVPGENQSFILERGDDGTYQLRMLPEGEGYSGSRQEAGDSWDLSARDISGDGNADFVLSQLSSPSETLIVQSTDDGRRAALYNLVIPSTGVTPEKASSFVKSFPETATLVGKTAGSFSVSSAGAATYRLPIEVVDGLNGHQPRLALTYNSRSGNGILGKGWSLSGISTIQRCSSSPVHGEETFGGVTLSTSDRLCMGGERLILVDGESYWADGATYRTERDSQQIITKQGNKFQVENNLGHIKEFISLRSEVWVLSDWKNEFGQVVTITYHPASENSSVVMPERISYGSGAVGFSYGQGRNDIPDRYLQGEQRSLDHYLRSIQVLRSNKHVRDYELHYDYDVGSGDLALQYAQLCAFDSSGAKRECALPLELRHEQIVNDVTEKTFSLPVTLDAGSVNRPAISDWNGDGVNDFLKNSPEDGVTVFLAPLGDGGFTQENLLSANSNRYFLTPFVSNSGERGIVYLEGEVVQETYQKQIEPGYYETVVEGEWKSLGYSCNVSIKCVGGLWSNDFSSDYQCIGGQSSNTITVYGSTENDPDQYGRTWAGRECSYSGNASASGSTLSYSGSALGYYPEIKNYIEPVYEETQYNFKSFKYSWKKKAFRPIGEISTVSIGSGRVCFAEDYDFDATNDFYRPLVGDFNGNGDQDIYVGLPSCSSVDAKEIRWARAAGQDDVVHDIDFDILRGIPFSFDGRKKNLIAERKSGKFEAREIGADGVMELLTETGLAIPSEWSVFADINADGLSDIVSFGQRVAGEGRNQDNIYVFLNTGGSYQDPIELGYSSISGIGQGLSQILDLTRSGDAPISERVRIYDYDQNGIADLLILNGQSPANSDYANKVFLLRTVINAQKQPVFELLDLGIENPNTTDLEHNVLVYDADGDARPDILMADNGRYKLLGQPKGFGGLVNSFQITFPSGEESRTNVQYARLNDPSVYEFTWKLKPDYRTFSGPLSVVKTASIPTKKSVWDEQKYFYSNAKVHLEGRGFLGFESYSVESPLYDRKTVFDFYGSALSEADTFFPEFPFIGSLVSKTIENTATGNVVAVTVNSWSSQALTKDDLVQRLYLGESLTQSYDPEGQLIGANRVTTALDGFGNLQSRVTESGSGLADPSQCVELGSCQLPSIQKIKTETFSYSQSFPTFLEALEVEHVSPNLAIAGEDVSEAKALTTYYTFEPHTNLPYVVGTKVTSSDLGGVSDVVERFEYATDGEQLGQLRSQEIESGSSVPSLNRIELRKTTFNAYQHGVYPSEAVNAEGQTENYEIDFRSGHETQVRSVDGLYSNYQYDPLGRLTRETAPTGFTQTNEYKFCENNSCPSFSENSAIRIVQRGNDDSETVKYLDAYDREVAITEKQFDGTSSVQTTSYDDRGRVSRVSEPYRMGGSPLYTGFSYSDIKDFVQVTKPDLSAMSIYTYGTGLGKTVEVTTNVSRDDENGSGEVADRVMRRVAISNLQGNTTSVLEYIDSGVTVKTDLEYDAKGRLIWSSVNNASGNSSDTRISYDDTSHSKTLKDPDTGITVTIYNSAGEIVREAQKGLDPAGGQDRVLSYSFDRLGRQTSVEESNSGLLGQWLYDVDSDGRQCGNGRLCELKGPLFEEKYFYENRSGLTSSIETSLQSTAGSPARDYVFSYDYDHVGRQKRLSYPSGFAIERAYSNSYLSTVSDVSNGESRELWSASDYDVRGQVTSSTLGNGLGIVRSYDEKGRLTSVSAGIGSAPEELVQSAAYGYDSIGNLVYRAEELTGFTESFHYDGLNRLVTQELTSSSGTQTNSYSYDHYGNLMSKPGAGTYQYSNYSDSAYCSQADEYATPGPHAVREVGANVYCYDEYGGQIRGAGRNIRYSVIGKPSKIIGEASVSDFLYGPDERRFYQKKQVSGSVVETFYIAKGAFEEEIRDGQSTFKSYLDGFLIDKRGAENSQIFLLRDHLGSVDVVVDSDVTDGLQDSVIETTSFEPFGERRLDDRNGSTLNPSTVSRGFTDHEHLDDFGLIHMDGRVYDPYTARFISADPYVQDVESSQSWNRYSYVWNSPLTSTDPSGFFCIGICDINIPFTDIPFGFDLNWLSNDNKLQPVNSFLNGLVGNEPSYGVFSEGAEPYWPIELASAENLQKFHNSGSKLGDIFVEHFDVSTVYESFVEEGVTSAAFAIAKKYPVVKLTSELSERFGALELDVTKKVDLNLKYKDGWTDAQKAAADAKCQALCDANTVVTQAQRSGTSASSRYKRAGNTVSPGNDVDHVVDLQLGGADSVSNMLPLNSSVNRSLGSQIHHQIKNLPAGTVVDKVNIQ